MATRTVRLDPEAERTLAWLVRTTGLSISELLKRGLESYRLAALDAPARRSTLQILRGLDLGPGGYARAPARDAKSAVKDAIRRKHSR